MYDLALMRVMGASQSGLFMIIILEGLMLTVIGSFLGVFSGHIFLQIIGHFQDSSQAKVTGLFFMQEEVYLIVGGLFIGIIASILPAIQAYRSDISKILSKS